MPIRRDALCEVRQEVDGTVSSEHMPDDFGDHGGGRHRSQQIGDWT